MYKRSLKVFLITILAFQTSCVGGLISTQLPEGASQEHMYLAVLEDYHILSKDVNALLVLPSTTKAEAEAIDLVLDRADEAIYLVEEVETTGGEVDYTLAITVINAAVREICKNHPEDVTACGGR